MASSRQTGMVVNNQGRPGDVELGIILRYEIEVTLKIAVISCYCVLVEKVSAVQKYPFITVS